MRKLLTAALPAMMFAAAPTAAHAESVNAIYRDGNVIRAYAFLDSYGPERAFQLAMIKIAAMASAKGYDRIGLTKISDCGTLKMYSATIGHSCRLLAQMVGPAEAAKPEGKRPVIYFSVPEILAGVIRPEPRDLPQASPAVAAVD